MREDVHLIHTFDALSDVIDRYKTSGERIGFVPTMGDLHEGHLSLIDVAKAHADKVCVSVFVNPLQFAPHEDFDSYPRQLAADCEALMARGVDLIFAPTGEAVYPLGEALHTQVFVPKLGEILCGGTRPHFFQGVATVCCKLINAMRADIAVFGRKDLQQWVILNRLVHDLCLPVKLYGGEIIRETDGLAMSSRNRYLKPEERLLAPKFYETLQNTVARLKSQAQAANVVLESAKKKLTSMGFALDYLEVRSEHDLGLVAEPEGAQVLFGCVILGRTRLIDNIPFTI